MIPPCRGLGHQRVLELLKVSHPSCRWMGGSLPLESYGARRAELLNLTPGAQRDRLMRSSAELIACIDLVSRESEVVVAVLASENARLRDELLTLRDAAARREDEAKTAQVARSEHAQGKLEAEAAHRRLEE